MDQYKFATICINGHVISSTDFKYTRYCDKCGKGTISTCQNCNNNIRGVYETEYGIGINYVAPAFCYSCGHPFPWTEQLLSNAIELISLDEELPDTDKDIIKNAFPDLIVETPSSPVAVAKYKKLIPRAASYVQAGLKNLFVDVVSETVKKAIWG